MSIYRQKRVADLLYEEISQIIQFEMQDPCLELVTVTGVEVKDNLRQAHVYVSVPVDDVAAKRDILGTLRRASGFISQALAESTPLTRLPRLIFHLDNSLERSTRVEELLTQIAIE